MIKRNLRRSIGTAILASMTMTCCIGGMGVKAAENVMEDSISTETTYAVETGSEITDSTDESVNGETNEEIWTYAVEDGAANILAYHGNDEVVEIPSQVTIDDVLYTVKGIGEKAFENKTMLKEVIIPKKVSTIGPCAFKNCTNLTSVIIQGNIKDCESASIHDESGNAWDRSSTNSVFYNAGTDAESLTVTFTEGVTYVPAYLFATYGSTSDGVYCRVSKVVLSDTVKTVGEYAFYNCHNLTEIQMGSGIKEIKQYAFSSMDKIRNIILGSSVESIETGAFANNKVLEQVTLPENLKNIGEKAFYNCVSLKNIVCPSKLDVLGASAFENCTGLKEISLPKSNCSIGTCVFKNCTNLTSVIIQGNIKDCESASIHDEDGNAWDRSSTNSVFYNAGTDAESLTVTFTEGVTYVPAYLFATYGEKSDQVYAHVTAVNIPSSVEKIGKYAFYNCYDLKTLNAIWKDNCVFDENCIENNSESLKILCKHESTAEQYFSSHGIKIEYTDLARVTGVALENNQDGIKIAWNKLSGAKEYQIYRKKGNEVATKIATVPENTWTDKSVKSSSGQNYMYYVIASDGRLTSGKYTNVSLVRLVAPVTSSVENTKAGVTIKWKKVSGAKGYNIWCKVGKKAWKKIASVGSNKTTYVDKTAVDGSRVYYVQAYNGSSVSEYNTNTVSSYYLSAGAINKISNTKSKTMTVTYKKNAKADGYVIRYSKKSNMSGGKTVKVTSKKTINKKITKLTVGKTYYVQVKSYKKANGKTYESVWSSKKKIKIKK